MIEFQAAHRSAGSAGRLLAPQPERVITTSKIKGFCELWGPCCLPDVDRPTQRENAHVDEVHDHLERASQGSPIEYENAQKRILDVFTQWEAPSNFKIELFVIRVGDWGGYMMLDCDDPLAVHEFCSMLPAFVFEARPVVPVMDAVGWNWRRSLP